MQEIHKRVDRPTGGNDYFLLTIAGRRIVVDRGVARMLRPGDSVGKKRFSRTLSVNGEPRRLHLSRDFHHMLFAYPLLALLTALALIRNPQTPVPRRKSPRAK